VILSWQRFELGLRLVLCSAPALVCVFSLAEFPGPSGWILLGSGLLAGVVAITLPAVAVVATERAVWLVGVPFWAVRIPWHRVADVSSTEVRPVEDFGGWGIKGSSRRRGLLFAASSTAAVRIGTHDGRQFLATCNAPDQIAALLTERAGAAQHRADRWT
jgi:hypothetical protein